MKTFNYFLKHNYSYYCYIYRFGVGLCLCGTHGTFTQARTFIFPGLLEPREAEAWELLEALKRTNSMNLANVTYELECKSVVDEIRHNSIGSLDFHCILSKCRVVLLTTTNSLVSLSRR